MSPRSSDSGSKPVADIYVGLLVVSVSALLFGIIFLVMELQSYGWKLAP